MSSSERWDVIVVGGGPAGSTAATLLSQHGHRVLLLEKESFPRFHVGESLLPACQIVQSLLGIEPQADTFVFKRGGEFVSESTGRSAAFDFSEALPGPSRHAYQVDRAKFDALLLDRARSLGAEVRLGVAVDAVELGEDEVVVRAGAHTERARYVIDASGQNRLLAKQHRSAVPLGQFGRAASFTHYEGLSPRQRAVFEPHNDIRIMMIEDGWAWVIPLPGGRLSVGIVSRRGGMRADDVEAYVASSPLVSSWTEGTRRTPNHLISDFSYRNVRPHGPRFACVGDAAGFIDPVFSSGVSLAVRNAAYLVEELAPALDEGTEAEPQLAARASERMQPAYETFASLVYRFYNTRFVENFMFNAPPEAELKPNIISVLAGDVFRDDNPFQSMLLSSRILPWKAAANP